MSRHYICRPQFQPRYRDRYAFAPARGQSWQCQYDPYPRDWWAQDDGWYDQSGRYTYDDRYVGDSRWSRGGRRW